MAKGITRRDALKQMGAVAGAAMVVPALAGCSDKSGATDPTPDAPTPDAPLPDAHPNPDAADTGITTIVIVMMENRTYDHYLGARKLLEGKGGDGLVDGMGQNDMGGTFRPIYRESVDCVADPPHGWDASRVQFNGGANDGFMKAYQAAQGVDIAPYVVGYFGREDLPVTYALADAYTMCDRWFASVMGPTFPNRWYLHSGQSGGYNYNELQLPSHWPTIYDRLDAAGVPWRYYYTDLPFLLTMGVPIGNQFALDQYFVDAMRGELPPVVMVDPGFALNDDHPPHHPLLGQQFIASIYNALATSPQWRNTLMVVTYDEHGGFFDHVAPPTAPDDRAAQGFDQLGFRVPTLILGPYAKKGHISSVVHDHTSVLKHIENMFSLQPLTMRDAAASDLNDAIDLDRLASRTAEPPITLPVVNVDINALDPLCTMSDFKPSDMERMADMGLIPPQYDRRPRNRDTALMIGDYLAKHGLGGIRRR
jgi:phospholipase C